jgi:hypothetical protein
MASRCYQIADHWHKNSKTSSALTKKALNSPLLKNAVLHNTISPIHHFFALKLRINAGDQLNKQETQTYHRKNRMVHPSGGD